MLSRPEPFRRDLEAALPDRPFAVRFWDGTLAAPTNGAGPTSRRARPPRSRTCCAPPASSGWDARTCPASSRWTTSTRARGAERWQPPPIDRATSCDCARGGRGRAALQASAARPAAELRPRGRRHSDERDARAVRHHYDVSNEFFALFLDESMTYSCAIFSRGATTLEEAQRGEARAGLHEARARAGRASARHRLRLGQLRDPRREQHGVDVVGITLSEPQAELARQRAAEARRVRPGRDPRHGLPRPRRGALRRDREHRHGGARRREPDRRVRRRLRRAPEARRARCSTTASPACVTATRRPGPFSERYVFPDAEPLHLSRVLLALERAGFETEHVEGFGERLRRDAAPLGAAPGRALDGGRAPRRARARARLAPLPARRAQRLRDRLHVGLPGALLAAVGARRSGAPTLQSSRPRSEERRRRRHRHSRLGPPDDGRWHAAARCSRCTRSTALEAAC